jgi:hypothetical protein
LQKRTVLSLLSKKISLSSEGLTVGSWANQWWWLQSKTQQLSIKLPVLFGMVATIVDSIRSLLSPSFLSKEITAAGTAASTATAVDLCPSLLGMWTASVHSDGLN